MKYLIFVVCLSICSNLLGQRDQQWYVTLERPDGVMQNEWPSSTISIKPAAVLSDCSDAYSDIFVIYSADEFYLKRSSQIENQYSYFDLGQRMNGTAKGVCISNLDNKNIQFLYWTNNYQDDPPPDDFVVTTEVPSSPTDVNEIGYGLNPPVHTSSENDGILGLGGIGGLSEVNDNPEPIANYKFRMLTNHNVVPEKDITIILNVDSLRKSFKDSAEHKLTLSYNEILNPEGENEAYSIELLKPEDIFKERFCFPCSGVEEDNGSVQIDLKQITSKFVYLNFRAQSSLSRYFIEDEEMNCPNEPPNSAYRLLFKLVNQNNEILARIAEKILPAHDPNELNATSYCLKDKGGTVTFEGHFTNTGSSKAKNISFDNLFPEELHLSAVELQSFTIGSRDYKSKVYLSVESNRKIKAVLDRKITLMSCKVDTFDNCYNSTAVFKIKASFKNLTNENINRIFSPNCGKVYFGGNDPEYFTSENKIPCEPFDILIGGEKAKFKGLPFYSIGDECIRITKCENTERIIVSRKKPRFVPDYHWWDSKKLPWLKYKQ